MPYDHERARRVMREAELPADLGGSVVHVAGADAIPDLRCRANPGVTMTVDGEPRVEGDEFVLPGPNAHQLSDRGYVTILGAKEEA